LIDRSLHQDPFVDPNNLNNIIMLSTCTNRGETERMIVVAQKV